MAMATDPVCGMQVDTENAKWTAEHDGGIYYFCSKGCMLDFQDDPAKFTSPDYTPAEMEMDSHS